MGVYYSDECVGCPKEMGCLGKYCSYMNVPHYYCDNCNGELWENEIRSGVYGEELCEECYNEMYGEDEEDDEEE